MLIIMLRVTGDGDVEDNLAHATEESHGVGRQRELQQHRWRGGVLPCLGERDVPDSVAQGSQHDRQQKGDCVWGEEWTVNVSIYRTIM